MVLDHLFTSWSVFQALFLEAVPFLLIGVVLATMTRHWLPPGPVLRCLPDHPLLGPLTGAAMGFALPACECGNVPVARQLLASGSPLPTAMGFLFAAPVLNPIVLASTWAAFPDQPWLLWARPAAGLAMALLVAVLLRLQQDGAILAPNLVRERGFHQPAGAGSLLEHSAGLIGSAHPVPMSLPSTERGKSWRLSVLHGMDELVKLASLLILGCAVAALLQTTLPRDWLLAVGQAPTLSILALMLLAVVISVCSSVDAFLALGFASQVTPGALLAFLILGPVIDLKSLGLYGTVFCRSAMVFVGLACGVLALLAGQWTNFLML
ncbi:permease [Candidatus Synechococcus spongiarum]|uniref:Possible permease n=1 Tax=Candidatus Synechococcus spongiarum TaxID=431041 RepID=A0A164Z4S4_9SYNE|nr:permease [Candidatus Synechococcus spongiarum]SAY38824.1 Possible permease [Candidatus Synechococcus spongiarum]